jgi:hypothetical protein
MWGLQVTIPCKKQCFRLYGREGVPLVDLMIGENEAPPQVRIPSLHPFQVTAVLWYKCDAFCIVQECKHLLLILPVTFQVREDKPLSRPTQSDMVYT